MSTAVAPESPVRSTSETEVDRQIDQAAGRIRMHDAIVGILVLGSLTLAYGVGMMIVDKSYVLPDAARQASLGLFGIVFATVAYLVLVRPLARRVNPLYAAMQVERTIEDAKNSVAGYVELKERELNPHVRSALSSRAAQAVGEADLNRTVNHRSLTYLGSIFGVMILALVVLLVLFRPSQFLSLLGRAFNPFKPAVIVSKTQIVIQQPEGGNTTVTSGKSVDVAVHLIGRVPSETSPDRVRALIRYSATDAMYEEVPLERGASKFDWSVQIPAHLVQNGFWYKVAAGDGETAEYRVTVRTLPQFQGFEIAYEYPEYLRMAPMVVPENPANPSPFITGFRGTQVTLTARTNRDVRDGRLDGPPQYNVRGEPVPGRLDSLRFRFTLQESASYRLSFNAANGERSNEAGPYKIDVLSDQPPTFKFLDPREEEEQTTRPANSRLSIDASIADDFGLAGVTLRMRIKGARPIPLAPKPFLEGKSLRRESDGTFSTTLDYKGSIDFARLTTEAGGPAKVQKGTIIEYWLEATDNQEPKANLGASKIRSVTLGEPIEEKRAENVKKQRDQQEQAGQKAEQNRLDREARPKNPGPLEKPAAPQAADPAQAPPPADGANPMPKAQPNEGDPAPPPMPQAGQPMNGQPPQNPEKGAAKEPMGNEPGEPGGPPQPGQGNATGEPKPTEEQLKQDAQKVQDAIKNQATQGGEAKPSDANEPGERKPDAASKSAPMDQKAASPENKDAGEGAQGTTPQNKPGAAEPESKPQGNVQPPPPPATEKPEPRGSADTKPMTGDAKGTDDQPQEKSEPVGQPAGTDKESPESPKPMGSEAKTGNSPKTPGGEGKPSSGKASSSQEKSPMGQEPKGQPNGETSEQEASAKPQPQQQPSRGNDKPSSGGGTPSESEATDAKSDAASGKGETAPPQGKSKSRPPMASDDASEAKPPMTSNDAEPEQKPEGGSTGKPEAGKPNDNKGSSKSSDPGELAREMVRKSQQDPNAESKPNPKDGPDQLLRDRQKFEQTARDLNSKDENTRRNAENNMDRAVGKEGREQARESAKNLDSAKPEEQKKAEEDVDQLRKKNKNEAEARKEQSEQQERKDELAKKSKDLNSPDQGKREQAEKDLDKQIGQKDRKDLQNAAKEAAGGESSKEKALDQKLDELAKKGGQGGSGHKDPQPTPEQVADMKKTLEDLGSDNKSKREAAEQKLDQQIGKDRREKMQDAMKDAKDNPAEAKRKLDEMAKEAAGQTVKQDRVGQEKDKGISADEQKKLEEKLADLNSPDDKKRQEAEKAFDERLGKDQREKLQQAVKDGDKKPGTGGEKQDTLADAKKKLNDMAKDPNGKKSLDTDEQKKLEEKLADLNSPDDKKRQEAEKAFDEKLGKEKREKLQEAMKNNDKKPGTPQESQDAHADAKQKLDEMAKAGRGQRDPRGNNVPEGGVNSETQENTPADADPKNLAKSAELQLERFKEKQFDQDFLKSIGKNEEEYQRFLRGYQEMVDRLRNEAAQPEKSTVAPKPSTPTINAGSAGTVDARGGPDAANGTTGGPAYAPPGFSGAKEKFNRDVLKLKTPTK